MKMWILSFILLSPLSFAMGACSPDNNPVPKEEPGTGPQPGGGHALVVYFSCTGTTKGVAEQIAGLAGADTWRIVPETAYTSEDLNYNNSSSRANREQNDPSARPAISGKCENITAYDVIFLGYPIWWGKAPKILFTFLENHGLSGKTVVPFCTSHSSGIGSSDTDLHSMAPQATWKQGRRFNRNETKETIMNWIQSMDLNLDKGDGAGRFVL